MKTLRETMNGPELELESIRLVRVYRRPDGTAREIVHHVPLSAELALRQSWHIHPDGPRSFHTLIFEAKALDACPAPDYCLCAGEPPP